jgi:hypothetical protein
MPAAETPRPKKQTSRPEGSAAIAEKSHKSEYGFPQFRVLGTSRSPPHGLHRLHPGIMQTFGQDSLPHHVGRSRKKDAHLLLNGNRLRQIPRLIHIAAAPYGNVVRQQLQWNDLQNR